MSELIVALAVVMNQSGLTAAAAPAAATEEPANV